MNAVIHKIHNLPSAINILILKYTFIITNVPDLSCVDCSISMASSDTLWFFDLCRPSDHAFRISHTFFCSDEVVHFFVLDSVCRSAWMSESVPLWRVSSLFHSCGKLVLVRFGINHCFSASWKPTLYHLA